MAEESTILSIKHLKKDFIIKNNKPELFTDQYLNQ